MSGAENPFAPPETETQPGPEEDTHVLRTRREHLPTEVQLRALGSLFLVVGTVVMVWSASILVIISRLNSRAVELIVPSFALGVSVAFIALAFLLRRLEPRVFWPAVTGAAVLIFTFPYGTPLGLYALFILLQPKSRRVMTAEYASIRQATPQVVYRTPLTVWLLLAVLVVSLVLLFAFRRF